MAGFTVILIWVEDFLFNDHVEFQAVMGRGYDKEEVRRRVVSAFSESETALSGTELALRTGINRVTLTKYLEVLFQKGVLRRQPVGNVTLWSMERGSTVYSFPADYFLLADKYREVLMTADDFDIFSLVRNCMNSDADPVRLVNEMFIPAIEYVSKMYADDRISYLELCSLEEVISRSLRMLDVHPGDADITKNCILMTTEHESALYAKAAAATMYPSHWRVHNIGDISGAVNVFFDLDIQKLLGRVWLGSPGVMIVVIIGATDEALQFLCKTVNSVRKKINGRVRVAVCAAAPVSDLEADMVTTNMGELTQWCETVAQSVSQL